MSSILNHLSNLVYLEDLPNLLSTCKEFESKINITQILISNDQKSFLPKFLLTNKWTNIIYSQNPNFILPLNYILKNIGSILLNLIFKNSINGIKLINNHLQNDTYTVSFHFYDYYLKGYLNDVFEVFVTLPIIIVNQIELIFAYKFGSEDMLKLLLEYKLIKNITDNNIYSYFNFKGEAMEVGNLVDFIIKMEKQNNWNTKSLVFKQMSIKLLLDLIIADKYDIVGEILMDHDHLNIDDKMSEDIIQIILFHKYINLNYSELFSHICKSFAGNMKIKHQILLVGCLFSTKDMMDKLYQGISWSEDDIKIIKLIGSTYNL
jgi:hypothetical protein